MHRLLSGSAMALALLTAATAAAQTPIDTQEPAFDAAADVAAPAPTGDPVLDRLNALEAKVRGLESRNRLLEDQLDASQARIQSVEVRAAKGVQANVSPTLADPNGVFTFKARGVVDAD